MVRINTDLGAGMGSRSGGLVASLTADKHEGRRMRLAEKSQQAGERQHAQQMAQRERFHADSLQQAELQRVFADRQAALGFLRQDVLSERAHGRATKLAGLQADRADARDTKQYQRQRQLKAEDRLWSERQRKLGHTEALQRTDHYYDQMRARDAEMHKQKLQLGAVERLGEFADGLVDAFADMRINQAKLDYNRLKDTQAHRMKAFELMVNKLSANPRASRIVHDGNKFQAAYHQRVAQEAYSRMGTQEPQYFRDYVEKQTGEPWTGSLADAKAEAGRIASRRMEEFAAKMNYVIEEQDQDRGLLAQLFRSFGDGDSMFETFARTLDSEVEQGQAMQGQGLDPGHVTPPMPPWNASGAGGQADWSQPWNNQVTGPNPMYSGPAYPSVQQFASPAMPNKVLRPWNER